MSRYHQPPLPPGPPPPRSYNNHPRQADRFRGGDSYHPADRYNQPSPPMYHFQGGGSRDDPYQPRGGDSYHPQRDDYRRPRSPPRNGYRDDRSAPHRPDWNEPRPPIRDSRDDDRRPSASYNSFDTCFNFRQPAPPGIDYSAADRARDRSPPRRHNQGRNGYTSGQNNFRGRAPRGGYGRGRGGPRLASDREFLKINREHTPELMPGMDEDVRDGVRYKPLEELSDSDEAEMDMSENEEAQEPRAKQARTGDKAADADSVPRWSNPDPYTVLPPPDESLRKKKDVVKLIRKARVNTISETTKVAAANDDFISFDFDDEEAEEDGQSVDSYTDPRIARGIEGAPTGPRTADKGKAIDIGADLRGSYNRHPRDNGPPGTTSSTFAPAAHTNSAKFTAINAEPDLALGNRKRTIDDEIKGPPRLHKPIRMGQRIDGSIDCSWLPKAGQSPTPWNTQDHSDSASTAIWLHKEIMDFYHWVRPRKFEQRIRDELVSNLRHKVQSELFTKDADIYAFGSFPAGLYLPTADMDLVCNSAKYMRGQQGYLGSKSVLHKFKAFLHQNSLNLDNIELIPAAKVPLVKYVDRLTGLKVDISFENETGLIANKTFQEWKAMYPALPILVSLIKHLLAMRTLNEPAIGGIGGFSVICLVVSLLQHLPQVQASIMTPEHHLGELLMEFFKLYGNEFNVDDVAIVLNPPAWMPKTQVARENGVVYRTKLRDKHKLSIIDPNRPDNDIAGGSHNTPLILKVFANCYKALLQRMHELQHSPNRRYESILGCIIGGNYASFELQREHLAHVHERLYGLPNHDAA